jgi:hypothetical protein
MARMIQNLFSILYSQSKYTLATQEIGNKPNATNIVDGNNPVWNDIIFVETIEENVDSEGLLFIYISVSVYRPELYQLNVIVGWLNY